MKPTCRYFVTAFLSVSLFVAKAKEGNSTYNSPVQFIQNKGQITDQHGVVRKDIDAKVEANGVVLFVGDGELHYQWVAAQSQNSKVKSQKDLSSASVPPPSAKLTPPPPKWSGQAAGDNAISEVEIYRMDVKLVGANKNAEVIFEGPTGYYENYYLAHTGEDGVRAKGFQRVIYKDIYKNIDLVFYTAGVPGASVPPPSAKLTPPLAGDNKLSLSPGACPDRFGSGGGEVRAGGGILAQGIYNESPLGEIEGQTSRGIKYDFIIHPGGNPADIQLRYEGATELKLADGSLVATTPYGSITEEAPYSYIAGVGEAIISAYKLSGNTLTFDIGNYTGTLVIDPTLKWATYYGGSLPDWCSAAAADTVGQAYMTGYTSSSNNIATTGAHRSSITGHRSFIVKFNTAGQRVWGTYYGGIPTGIAVDPFNHIVISGYTTPDTAVTTAGAYQQAHGNGSNANDYDMFIAKFDSNGVRQWGTYYGDTGANISYDMAVDRTGNIYLAGNSGKGLGTPGTFRPNSPPSGTRGFICKFTAAGQRVWGTYIPGGNVFAIAADDSGYVYAGGATNADTGIATTGAHQTIRGSTGGIDDGFIMRFNSSGQRLWGSYYGGGSYDDINDIAANSHEVYIVGETVSTGGIATAGTHQTTKSTGGDGFIARLTPQGQRVWGSYFGGSGTTGTEDLRAVTIRPEGDVLVGGVTHSSGLATPGAYQTTIPANTQASIAAQFSNGGSLLWASYFCGNDLTLIYSGIAYGKQKLYLAGATEATGGIATNGAHQTSNTGGWEDAFLVQFEMKDTLAYIASPVLRSGMCTGDTLYVPYKVTSNFRSNNTFTIQLSNASGSFGSPVTLATINGNTAGTANCVVPALPDGTGYKLRIISTGPADTSEPSVQSIAIYNKPANFTAGSNSPLCSGDTLELNSGTTTTGVTYSWAGPGSFTSADDDTVIANTTVANTGDYYITVNNNGCMVKDTVSVVVNQTPQNVTAGNNGGLCTGDTLLLTSSSTTSSVSYAWTGPNNYNTQNVTRPNVQMSDAGTYKVTVTLGSCSDTAMTTVVVNQGASVNIAPLTPISICTGDTAQFAAFPNNAGTNPQLQWLKNGVAVSGATGTLYKTSTLVNGDIISVLLTPNTSCPGSKESNKITMTVQPILTPTVTMTADKMPPWNGGLTVTFTATPTHGGTAPEYQWKRNGQDITGATSATWGVVVNALNDNEDICVVLKSSYECAVPDTAMSNCITTAFTGLGGIVRDKNIKIYPNPVSGILHIEGVEAGSTIELIDVLGRSVRRQLLAAQGTSPSAPFKGGTVDVSSLVPGVYVVRVNGVVAGRVVKE